MGEPAGMQRRVAAVLALPLRRLGPRGKHAAAAAALAVLLRRGLRRARRRLLFALAAAWVPVLVCLAVSRSQLLQPWRDRLRRSRARLARQRTTDGLRCELLDPFVRIPGALKSFEEAYEVLQRITDSTYGKVFECRSRDRPEDSLVVKIVPQRSHPLLKASTASCLRARAAATGSLGRRNSVVETEEFHRYMGQLLQLRHDNVVRYLQFFADSSFFYFVMERCPGQTVLELLLSRSAWHEVQAPPLLRQLLCALGYIHGLGLVHRDVKLENLMVSPEWQLRLLDFGLGCEAARARGVLGTMGYIAPEVLCSETYGCSADVFSAGVVLSILLTGRPPFKPPVAMKFLKEHLQALQRGPDLCKEPFPLVTEGGRDLLEWMLTPDAQARCTAAEALRHRWFRDGAGWGFHGQMGGPVLWCSSNSQLRFLQVMGVWSDGSSRSGATLEGAESLGPIEEAEGEREEGLLEELCCQLVRHMQVPVCIADPAKPDCPVVAISDGFVNLTGYGESDIVGNNCRVLNEPRAAEIPGEMRAQLREAASGLKPFLGIVPNMKADGTPFYNLLHLSAIDVKGKDFVVGIQMEVQDHDVDLESHTILGSAHKVHTAIRHWIRSPVGLGDFMRAATCSPTSWARSASAP